MYDLDEGHRHEHRAIKGAFVRLAMWVLVLFVAQVAVVVVGVLMLLGVM